MFKDVFWKDEEEEHQQQQQQPQEQQQQQQQQQRQQKGQEGVPGEQPQEGVEEEDYDPFAHRKVAKPTSDFGALAHIIKTSFGSGILAMPMAFKYSGLVIGAVGTVMLGVIATHCVQMLVKNSQNLCKKHKVPTLSFSETAEKAFLNGPKKFRKMSKVVGFIITVELLGSFILGNSVYVVFMSHTLFQIAEFYWKPGVDIRVYSAMLWIPLMLMCLLPNLKSLVPFSITANIFVLVSFSITLYYIFRNIKPFPTVELVARVETWPLFMGTVIFAIEGIGTVLSIENEMKHPKHFVGVPFGILYIGMLIVILLYGFIGFFGYLEYGQETKGSIALNLPTEEPLAQAVKALIALAIFFTYALQFYVPIHLIVKMITAKLKENYHFYTKIGVRVGLVTVTIVISIVIPHLEPIISLVGAVCFAMLGLLFPAMIDTMAKWPHYGRCKWNLWKNISIQLIAILILTTGVHSSILDIIESYAKDLDDDF